MKKVLFALFLLLGTFAMASITDINTSKGTDQLAVESFSPESGDVRVSRYAIMEVKFNVPLDAEHIKEHDIKLTYMSSQTNEHVAGTISYSNNTLIFKPDNLLAPGTYEVEFKSLKTDSTTDTLIYAIKYRFVVVVEELLESITIEPETVDIKDGDAIALIAMGHYDNATQKDITLQVLWNVSDTSIVTVDTNATLRGVAEGVTILTAALDNITGSIDVTVYKEINGHRLPPTPDETINNSTLLGIDINNNDVRDDVERWIYETYKDQHPIHIDIAMQAGRGYKKVLETPERALEIHDEVRKARHCEAYYKYSAKYYNEPILIKEDAVNRYFRHEIYFNTKERMDVYIQYDTLLSGGSYTLPNDQEKKAACDFNTSKYEK